MTSKKTIASHFKLGAFFQFEALQAPFLPIFARILWDFERIFTKAKVLGVLLHPLAPCLLHQCLNIMPVVFRYGSHLLRIFRLLFHQVSATANSWKTKPQDILHCLG